MFYYKLKNGHYLKIMPDELCDNPRNFDNLFKFFGKTRTIGSPDSIDGIDDIEDVCNLVGVDSPEDFPKSKTHIVYTVSMYQHGNVAFRLSTEWGDSIGDAWDSGIYGVMFAEKSDIRRAFRVHRLTKKSLDRAFAIAQEELRVYENYVNGECYFYQEYNECGDEIDSCGGYYGYDEILENFDIEENIDELPFES